ncbi:MAG: prephenate dehydrogenase [Lentisphaeria bacterium]|nr:prephenate dehydrogenase [Lentisphaeria bacterium]
MVLTVVGLGLIGGSMAIDLRRRGYARHVIGVDKDPLHAATALRIGLVDEIAALEEALPRADVVVVAVPVDATVEILPGILDRIEAPRVVTDVASTKGAIVGVLAGHPRRRRFVPSHPMAGTEYSGPWAALSGLFDSKAAILCDREDSDVDAVARIETLYEALNMRLVHMDAKRHDVHVAYVSHISHVSSFALALTVLDKERDEKAIFDLASGGFSSSVRLAKSSADMWTPIFQHNSENVLSVLDVYVSKLVEFRRRIADKSRGPLHEMISDANRIRRVLGG